MKEILDVCLFLDESAATIYRNLSSNVSDSDLKAFWNRMHEEEKTHISWWESLLDLAQRGALPQIFDEPENVLNELSLKKRKVHEFLTQSSSSLSVTDQFLLAYRLEFYMLHAAFVQLWYFLDIVEPKESTPEQEYDTHISSFIHTMQKYGTATQELEVLGEAIDHLWTTIKQVNRDANLDILTNVLNRKALFNTIRTLAYLSKRNRLTSGMLLIDIDMFKQINDRYGHQKGDHVLRQVARIISSNTRRSDVFGRYGGEEFLLFLPQVEQASMENFAEKLRSSVETGTKPDIPATISIGGASTLFSGNVEKELDALIKKADDLMYQAKREGRNKAVIE